LVEGRDISNNNHPTYPSYIHHCSDAVDKKTTTNEYLLDNATQHRRVGTTEHVRHVVRLSQVNFFCRLGNLQDIHHIQSHSSMYCGHVSIADNIDKMNSC